MTGTGVVSTTVAKAAATAGTRYVFATNPQSIESIALDAADANGRITMTMRVAGADQKIEASPSEPVLIRTVRGVGYAFGREDGRSP